MKPQRPLTIAWSPRARSLPPQRKAEGGWAEAGHHPTFCQLIHAGETAATASEPPALQILTILPHAIAIHKLSLVLLNPTFSA